MYKRQVLLIGLSILKFKATMMAALLDGYALLLLLMLAGYFSMTWAGFMAFILAMLAGAVVFFKRA